MEILDQYATEVLAFQKALMSVTTGIDVCQTLFNRHPALLQKVMEEVKEQEDAKANDDRDQIIQKLKEKLEAEEKRSASLLEEKNKLLLTFRELEDKEVTLYDSLKTTAVERDTAQAECERLQEEVTHLKYELECQKGQIARLQSALPACEARLEARPI